MSPAGSAAACGPGWAVRVLIAAISVYRHMVSPLRLPSCRFMPTCSEYAVNALTEYGLFRGGWLILLRLGKCGPWHSGGWDPIPDRSIEPGDGLPPEVRSAHV